jgi:hypothetical protein
LEYLGAGGIYIMLYIGVNSYRIGVDMVSTARFGSVVALSAATWVPAVVLAAENSAEPTREQLQQELAELKARIAKLEAKAQPDSAVQASAQATRQDVLAD